MTYQLQLTKSETYLKSLLFIVANLAFPHLFHLLPGGGIMFLPIYFFTLIGAYKYGWKLGLMTAVLSPLSGYLIFGAPAAHMLVDMILKGGALAVLAGIASLKLAGKGQWVALMGIIGAVVLAQVVVASAEAPFIGAATAFQDFRTGWPGLMLQAFGGWALLKALKAY